MTAQSPNPRFRNSLDISITWIICTFLAFLASTRVQDLLSYLLFLMRGAETHLSPFAFGLIDGLTIAVLHYPFILLSGRRSRLYPVTTALGWGLGYGCAGWIVERAFGTYSLLSMSLARLVIGLWVGIGMGLGLHKTIRQSLSLILSASLAFVIWLFAYEAFSISLAFLIFPLLTVQPWFNLLAEESHTMAVESAEKLPSIH
jgi:hypothetical protein